uniref:Somatomedin-B and thrombospondin type-1 domain-containing protein-like isoform X2 n=1 Tax=Phascolarctos cinereus TaxID=38626 RepID=A0A6P5K4A8_PHACI|nr:somatomedin-B and thrombospondin type-1 domain-containing protein-like isoform X2 [Phascolarctos cinereus]
MAHGAILAWAWALTLGAVQRAQTGCAELGRCCPGRDLTCISRGWTAAGFSLGPQPCYCDQACSAAGDCCRDYGSACPVPALITTGAFRNGRKKRAVAHERKSAGYCVMFQLVTITVGCLQIRAPYTQWMRYLTQGHVVCVLCEPPALDMRSLRCYGDGKGSRGDQLFQWQALGNPSCRGTWKRFQQLEACSCPSVHSFLFV